MTPVVLGLVKTAMKRIAKDLVKQAIAGGVKSITEESLKKIVTKEITDTQAILFNKLKKIPSKKGFEVLADSMGIPVSDLKIMSKVFNQTAKMKTLPTTWKEIDKLLKLDKKIGARIKKELGIHKPLKTQKDFFRFIEEKSGSETNLNTMVYDLLVQIENALKQKIYGGRGMQSQYQNILQIDIDFVDMYDGSKTYHENTVIGLQKILGSVDEDIEYYQEGSGGDISLIFDETEWGVYERTAVLDFVRERKQDARLILDM